MPDLRKIFHFFTSNKTSESLKKKFWRWLDSPEYSKEKEEFLRDLWDESTGSADIDTENSLLMVKRKLSHQAPKARHNRFALKQFLQIASVLALCITTAFFTWHFVKEKNTKDLQIVEHVVPAGRKHLLTLSDGTKVVLNAGSIFVYPKAFTGPTRIVYLFGEGNFDVFPDKEQPFIVKTTQVAIKALGTKFNVLSYPEMDKLATTLEEGAVEVRHLIDSSQTFVLKPNEQVDYRYSTQSFSKFQVNAQDASRWIDGELYFSNSSLKDIISTLKRTYDVTVEADPRVYTADLYTLKLAKGESLRKTLRILELTVGNIGISTSDDGKKVSIQLRPQQAGSTSFKN